jgi:hypothetical protein
MGANAQTSVPDFTAGQVLTAAQMTEVNTGIPVFADSTARDAAFGGTGEKTLAEGQFAFLEDTNTTQFYDGATWQPVGVAPGLVLVKTQTIGSAVASVAVTDAFSATYDNYKIVVSGGVASTAVAFEMILGANTANYYYSLLYATYNNTPLASSGSNVAKWSDIGNADTTGLSFIMEINNPFLAKNTSMSCPISRTNLAGMSNGLHVSATSFTGFTLNPNAGTITGGTIRVYGYANS